MKTITKVLSVLTVAGGLIAQVAPALQVWISAHPGMTIGGAAAAVVAALVHNPSKV